MGDRDMSEAQGDIGAGGLRLTCFDRFPDELLHVPAWRLWQYLDGPSLFRIAGRRPEPLFVSVLLHGNEHTGWQAVQSVLGQHSSTQLPRSLLLFVGNIAAAKVNARILPTQRDYNRTWPGTTHLTEPESTLMKKVFEIVSGHVPYASIDIHNNTGKIHTTPASHASTKDIFIWHVSSVAPSSISRNRSVCSRRRWLRFVRRSRSNAAAPAQRPEWTMRRSSWHR